jgi:hypothetical protein
MANRKVLLVTLTVGLLLSLAPLGATAAPGPAAPSQEPEPECTPMAIMLATLIDDVADCTELMQYRQEHDVGWGVIMKAYLLSDSFGLDWRELVDRHMSEEGLGWGQLVKAHVLATALGANADDLLAQRAEGKGWGEILQEYREGPGKPPWAGQGKPPWAGQGKPPWAGPKEQEGTE